jgi:hypothetical protein
MEEIIVYYRHFQHALYYISRSRLNSPFVRKLQTNLGQNYLQNANNTMDPERHTLYDKAEATGRAARTRVSTSVRFLTPLKSYKLSLVPSFSSVVSWITKVDNKTANRQH